MKAGDILKFNAGRKIVVQYKRFLDMLAELKATKDDQIAKLYEALERQEDLLKEKGVPVTSLTAHLNQADWFDDNKAARLRKEILDFGNDLKREIENEISQYDIRL